MTRVQLLNLSGLEEAISESQLGSLVTSIPEEASAKVQQI